MQPLLLFFPIGDSNAVHFRRQKPLWAQKIFESYDCDSGKLFVYAKYFCLAKDTLASRFYTDSSSTT